MAGSARGRKPTTRNKGTAPAGAAPTDGPRPRQVTVLIALCFAMAVPGLAGVVTGIVEMHTAFDYSDILSIVFALMRLILISVGAALVGCFYVASALEIKSRRDARRLGWAEIAMTVVVVITIFPGFDLPLGVAGSGVVWLAGCGLALAAAIMRSRPVPKAWLIQNAK